MYYWQFSKNLPLPKTGGHFEFLPKMQKHKFASISATVRDRVILSKFSTPGVYWQLFRKTRFPATFGSHLEFLRKAHSSLKRCQIEQF